MLIARGYLPTPTSFPPSSIDGFSQQNYHQSSSNSVIITSLAVFSHHAAVLCVFVYCAIHCFHVDKFPHKFACWNTFVAQRTDGKTEPFHLITSNFID